MTLPEQEWEPSPNYEDQAASLLAEIADLLLGQKNWSALERLQQALKPTTPFTGLIGTDPTDPSHADVTRVLRETLSADTNDILKSIYSEKIREQMADGNRMREMLSVPLTSATPQEYITWTDTEDIATLSSGWSYSVNRRNGKSGPKGNK